MWNINALLLEITHKKNRIMKYEMNKIEKLDTILSIIIVL